MKLQIKMKKNMLKLNYLNLVGEFNIDNYIVNEINKNNITRLILRKNLLIKYVYYQMK